MSFERAFNVFMENNDALESAIDSATKASWGGSGYSVELFDDGTYRILWDNTIGNLYNSPGLMIGIPPLTDEEWDDDPDIRFYDNAKESIKEVFEQKLQEIKEYQEG